MGKGLEDIIFLPIPVLGRDTLQGIFCQLVLGVVLFFYFAEVHFLFMGQGANAAGMKPQAHIVMNLDHQAFAFACPCPALPEINHFA